MSTSDDENLAQKSDDIEQVNNDLNENFTYDTSTCFTCGGFYGPSFSDPLCATCHAFLFPQEWSQQKKYAADDSDIDSGNDEPKDGYLLSPGTPPKEDISFSPQLSYRLALLSIPQPHASPHIKYPVQSLPPEILLLIFSYLDDLSLWSVSQVCTEWLRLIHSHTPDTKWRDNLTKRFPLYKISFTNSSWYNVYTHLIESSSCHICLNEMAQKVSPLEENNWRRNRLLQEIRSIKQDPPQGIKAMPLDNDYCFWQASITGPGGSPYEGGLFFLFLKVPFSYPMDPPRVRFITRIFHPNISRHGDVGIDSIYHNWSLALTLTKVLVSIQSLLTDPFCEVCMEPYAGKLYMSDRDAYFNIARSWTCKYAFTEPKNIEANGS